MVVAATAAIFFLKPHHVTIIEKKGIPQVSFHNFTAYEIKKSGVTDILKGKRAQRFGSQTIVDLPDLHRLGERGEETVSARRAVFTEKRGIELKKDVKLQRSDGWTMRTSRLYYDLRNRLYTTGSAPFVITFGKSVVYGKKLRYYQKSGKIRAESIRAKIAEEDM